MRLAAALVATVMLFPLVASAKPAGATSLASAQAQAAQLAAQISAEQVRINTLSQDYDAAQVQVSQLDTQVAAAKAALVQMAAHVSSVEARLRSEAIHSWVTQGTGTSTMQALLEGNASTFMVRQQFINTVAGNEQDTIDSLDIARRAEHAKQVALSQAQSQAVAALDSVASDRRAAINETAAYQTTLAQVKGQIATIVAQIQARQAAARQAAARAAAQQLAQQEAAAQAAAQQQAAAADASGGGLSVGGGILPVVSVGGGSVPVVSAGGGPPPASSSGAARAVATALAQVGTPYVWGGAAPGGFDCSGLVMYAWASAGVSLPHYTVSQYDATTQIPIADAQPGDIVFYDIPGEGAQPAHEALYIGNGQVVSANQPGTNVQTQSMYYDGTIMGVGRVG